jgi:nicotinamide-nucleotide amidase
MGGVTLKGVPMNELLPYAEAVAALLKERHETVAVAESSAGGLVSAALLAVPGASAYFLGGVIVYTYGARGVFLGLSDSALANIRPATEPYALLLARTVRQRLSATWGFAETGATGPTGNRYGDPPGHACLAVTGPAERALTLETEAADRPANMRAFAAAALKLMAETLAR